MRTCACVLETYVRTDSTIYTARLIIEHPREWLASLADNRRAKLEFGELTACILYVRSDIGHIYIYIYILIPWLNVVPAENV